MARMNPVTEGAALPDEAKPAFELLKNKFPPSVTLPYYLFNSPAVGAKIVEFIAWFARRCSIPEKESTLAVLVVARHYKCDYEWGPFVLRARELEVEESVIQLIESGESVEHAPEWARTPILFARSLAERQEMPLELYNDAVSVFGEAGVVDLTTVVGLFGMLASFAVALDVEGDPNKPSVSSK